MGNLLLSFYANKETNMKLHTLALISTLALSAAAVHPAHADTLYSQAPTTSYAYYSGSGADYVSYDNFTLGANGTVTSVTWYGLYESSDHVGAYFTIDLFSNSSGTPGILLSSTTVGSGSPIDTGTYQFPGYDIYSYSAAINPFSATAGTEYWLSIVSSTSYRGWAWQGGSGGDGVSFADGTGMGTTTFSVPSDLAFTLSGSTTDTVVHPGAFAAPAARHRHPRHRCIFPPEGSQGARGDGIGK
jgi:hypothetical protein